MSKYSPKIYLGVIQNSLGFTGKEYRIKLTANESETIETTSLPTVCPDYIEVNKHYVFFSIPRFDTIQVQIFEFTDQYRLLKEGTFDVHSRSSVLDDDLTGFRVLSFKDSSDSDQLTLFLDFEDPETLYKTDSDSMKKLKNTLDAEKNILGGIGGCTTVEVNEFLTNLRFPFYVLNLIEEYLNWQDKLKTLTTTIFLTLMILNPKLSFVVLLFVLIFFHLRHRKDLSDFRLEKGRHELSENQKIFVFLRLADMYNKLVSSYTGFLAKLEKADTDSVQSFHKQLIKLAIFGGTMLYFCSLETFTYLAVLLLWYTVMIRNKVFNYAIDFLVNHERMSGVVSTIGFLLSCVLPFYDLEVAEKQTIRRSISFISEKTVTYEVRENERWWIVVGFIKSMNTGDWPIWSDIKGILPYGKENVKLPGDNYEWLGDWEHVINEETDEEGWQYASNFSNTLVKVKKIGHLVRSRVWRRSCKRV